MAEKSEKHRTAMPRLKIPTFRRNSSPNPSLHEERNEGDIFFSPDTLLKIKVSQQMINVILSYEENCLVITYS